MSTFVILLGGELHATPRLMSQVAGHSVIAADSGMEHAALLGVTPEAWLGDFDSAGEALFDRYPDVPRMAFPQDKDMTDGELAIAEALKRGASAFILAGAFGGPRIDHAFRPAQHVLQWLRGGLQQPTPMAAATADNPRRIARGAHHSAHARAPAL